MRKAACMSMVMVLALCVGCSESSEKPTNDQNKSGLEYQAEAQPEAQAVDLANTDENASPEAVTRDDLDIAGSYGQVRTSCDPSDKIALGTQIYLSMDGSMQTCGELEAFGELALQKANQIADLRISLSDMANGAFDIVQKDPMVADSMALSSKWCNEVTHKANVFLLKDSKGYWANSGSVSISGLEYSGMDDWATEGHIDLKLDASFVIDGNELEIHKDVKVAPCAVLLNVASGD
ncbi:MAG: hypothetical protein IJ268_08325 [Proteobacteria bacterium]|nr:hypothetical protein [Pseudomonadota bacterium]